MGCFAPDMPAPVNYGQQTRDTLKAQIDLAPRLYANEAKYQPQYANLALQNLNTLLNGSEGGTTTGIGKATADKTGWYDATGKFLSPQPREGWQAGASNQWVQKGRTFDTTTTQTSEAQPGVFSMMRDQNTQQRTSDIRDVANLGPEARAAMLAANPDQAVLLEKLNRQANEGLDAGSMLQADEARAMQQQSRAAFAARGMGGGNSSIADELLRQFDLGQQLLRQRQGFAQSVLGNNQAIVGDPFLQILGRPSGAIQTAQGIGQQSGPGLFNPESPLSGQITAGNKAYEAMFADPSTLSKVSGTMNAVGSFIGSIAGGAMCWAAREVFGEEDARWLLFRHWLLTLAPVRLREWYKVNGEAWAARLRLRPGAKPTVRRWMERRIGILNQDKV